MNKLLVVAILAFSLSVAYAREGAYGGYQTADYNKEVHEQAFNVAVKHLQEHGAVSANAVPHLELFQQKIVSGLLYKFVIRFGEEVYQVELWSQPWLNRLEVQSFQHIPKSQNGKQ